MTAAVVDAFATATVSAVDLLVVKLESPEYCAVIELAPAGKLVVTREAVPRESGSVPSKVLPFKNSIVPVGVPAPGLTGATLAVNVTLWPTTGEGVEGVSVVVLDAIATVTVTAGEVLVAEVAITRIHCGDRIGRNRQHTRVQREGSAGERLGAEQRGAVEELNRARRGDGTRRSGHRGREPDRLAENRRCRGEGHLGGAGVQLGQDDGVAIGSAQVINLERRSRYLDGRCLCLPREGTLDGRGTRIVDDGVGRSGRLHEICAEPGTQIDAAQVDGAAGLQLAVFPCAVAGRAAVEHDAERRIGGRDVGCQGRVAGDACRNAGEPSHRD